MTMRTNMGLDPATTRPFTRAELDRLRAYGRRAEKFEELAAQALRLRLLAVTGCVPGDVDAWRGVRRAEASALFGLGLMRTTCAVQFELRERVFAGACEHRDDNLGVMLAASMAADAVLISDGSPMSRPLGFQRG